MRGAGTRPMAIADKMRGADSGNWPWPVMLDVSRLVSRLGQGPLTGIDRVEAEWLAHLCFTCPDRLYLLCRAGPWQLVLPADAGRQILRWVSGDLADLPPETFLSRRRRQGVRHRAFAALRRMAVTRGWRDGRGMGRFLRRHLSGGIYLNLGHSNLDPGLWQRLKPLFRVVLIHDTIPLDYPQFTRPDQRARFCQRFSTAMTYADLVLTVSDHSRESVLAARKHLGLPVDTPVFAVPIGIRLATPAPQDLPAGLDLTRPYFVTIGTIEPRKNHVLLLDVWDYLAQELPADQVPQLFVVGRRGWLNDDVFARLDALRPTDPVKELTGLSDGAVVALLQDCHALLMPSHAEGFGLPMVEAAALGVPVLAAPLPTAAELLGGYVRVLPADNLGIWARDVMKMKAAPPDRLHIERIPHWSGHFSVVQAYIGKQIAAGAKKEDRQWLVG